MTERNSQGDGRELSFLVRLLMMIFGKNVVDRISNSVTRQRSRVFVDNNDDGSFNSSIVNLNQSNSLPPTYIETVRGNPPTYAESTLIIVIPKEYGSEIDTFYNCPNDPLSQLLGKQYGFRGADVEQDIYDLFPLAGDAERGIISGAKLVTVEQLEAFFGNLDNLIWQKLIPNSIINSGGTNGGVQTAMRIINTIHQFELYNKLSDETRKNFILFEQKVTEKAKEYNDNKLEKSLKNFYLKICSKNRKISYSFEEMLNHANQSKIFYNYEIYQDYLEDEEKLNLIKECATKNNLIVLDPNTFEEVIGLPSRDLQI